jgi:hypothetical protein
MPDLIKTDKQLKSLAGIHDIKVLTIVLLLDDHELTSNFFSEQMEKINILGDSFAVDFHCIFVTNVNVIRKKAIVDAQKHSIIFYLS